MIAEPPPPPAVEIIVGQVYSCTSAHAQRRLQATVGRVDRMPTGDLVISISLADKNPAARFPMIAHMPFAAATFTASCPSLLISKAVVPEAFEEGYRTWRQAADTGDGGYFTISVDQAVDYAESMVPLPPAQPEPKT